MKKILLSLLALLLCLAMVACGGKKVGRNNDDDDSSVSSEASVESSITSNEESDDLSNGSESEQPSSAPDEIQSSDAEASKEESSAPDVSDLTENLESGKYMLCGMDLEGVNFGYDYIVGIGVDDSYLQINSDGSFSMYLTDEAEVFGTYDATAKTLTAEGEALSYTVDGDDITVDFNGVGMIFTKGELPEITEPDVDTSDVDTPANAEIGKYYIYSMTSEGITVTKDQLGLLGFENSYLELKSDGTFIMELGHTIEGTHDAENKALIVEGDPAYYTLSGSSIILTLDDNNSVNFKK